jgi:hypothetical protein
LKRKAQQRGVSERDIQEWIAGVDFEEGAQLLEKAIDAHIDNMLSRSKHPQAKRQRDEHGRFVSSGPQPGPGRKPEGRKETVEEVLKRLFPPGDPFLNPYARIRK